MNNVEVARFLENKWNITANKISRLDNGSPNEVWRIDDDLQTYVFKRCRFTVDKGWYDFQNGVLEEWKRRKIPVSKQIRANTGEDYFLEDGQMYTLMEFVNAERYQLNNLCMLRQVAQLTVVLHKNNILSDNYKSAFNDLELWLANPQENLEQLIAVLNDIEVSQIDIKEYIRLVRKSVLFLNDNFSYREYLDLPKTLTHGELHHTNILFNNNQLKGLIDYDSIQIRPRIYDIARASLFLSRKKRGDFHVNKDFVYEFFKIYSDEMALFQEEYNSICYILLYYFIPTAEYIKLMKESNQLDWYIPWTMKGMEYIRTYYFKIIENIKENILGDEQ